MTTLQRNFATSVKTALFVAKAQKKYGNKFDYSRVDYQKSYLKVEIVCPIHGDFSITPANHLKMRHGCGKCGYAAGGDKLRSSLNEILERCRIANDSKYDYSLITQYKNNSVCYPIVCPVHGVFRQQLGIHVQGIGCAKCSGNVQLTTEEFVKAATAKHGNRYDYRFVEYKTSQHKVKIACSIHGVFEQRPHKHISGHGCPKCKSSHGEREVIKLLDQWSVVYQAQKKFESCRHKRKLPFDFYLPGESCVIEYNGPQHYSASRGFGEEAYQRTLLTDSIKQAWCNSHGIDYCVVKYNEPIRPRLRSILVGQKLKGLLR